MRPGERLPSIRQTCRTHAVSPVTVTQAYYLLESRGLIEARPKSGYFVRACHGQRLAEPEMTHPLGQSTELQVSDFIFQILESVRDTAVVPLGSSFPSPYLFPLDKLGRFLASAARQLNPRSTLSDLPPGNEELRRQLALRYLAPGPIFSAQREFSHCLRLNFGHLDSPQQQAAIATLGQLIAAHQTKANEITRPNPKNSA